MREPLSLKPDCTGSAGRRALVPALPLIERLLGLTFLSRVYERIPEGGTPLEFIDHSLEALGVRARTATPDLDRVPTEGPLVLVANHPYGAIEALVLAQLLAERRSDVKIMANYFLGRFPDLRPMLVQVDPFGTADALRKNLAGLREAMDWLAAGHALIVFPAGEVSHYIRRLGRVEDPPWLSAVGGIVRRARCGVVPVYFDGRNRLAFQLAGLIHPRLRTLMLTRELLARSGSTVEARFGSVIPYRQLESHATDEERVAYLRSRTYILGERPSVDEGPIQPRTTPPGAQPVAPARPTAALVSEIDGLPAGQLLVDGEDQVVYYAATPQIPELLQEIGRLRELSFREIGEGTGRESDLDHFDAEYRHLFIWSRADRKVVGAYRLGLTDEVMRDKGVDGLYTSTLFNFKPQLFEQMGPAIEMGRSFIRPEYQKSYQGLLLLWKGIGAFVVRHPRYATLFGPVSVSADYRSASQRLIVSFLERNRYAHDWSQWVRSRVPARVESRRSNPLSPSQLRNLDDVSTFISEIEADHKGVPILLKQYLKLGGRLLGFNVDPAFSNVLDVLIMVDLRRTKTKILQRYMGRDGVAHFQSHHPAACAS